MLTFKYSQIVNMLTANVHDTAKSIDYSDIIDKFALAKARKVKL